MKIYTLNVIRIYNIKNQIKMINSKYIWHLYQDLVFLIKDE